MNASTVRMKKEARALFWPWCAVMIAGALPLFERPSYSSLPGIPHWIVEPASFLSFFFGIPLLANLAFGNEFQHRTLSLLLTQPVDRMEIWREKLMVTAAAFVSAALVFYSSWRSVLQQDPQLLVLSAAFVITATASATFWTLLARSTMGGIALTGLALGVFELSFIIAAGANWEEVLASMTALWTIAFAALCYAALMLWLGRRKLARFQATGGMAGDDLLLAGPDVMPVALAGWFRYRPTEPIFNLIRKELRLLRTLWLMALLVVLYITCLMVLRLLPDRAQPAPRELVQVALLVPVFLFSFLMPVLGGCLSLGEERSSGTHSWHLTLPVAARRQWLIKLLVAVFTGFVCAVLLPGLVLLAGGFIFGSPFKFLDPGVAVNWMIVVPLLSLVSFWCACAVNGTVRAAIWIFPVTIVVNAAAARGHLMGEEMAKITGTLRDFVISWFQLSPPAFTSIQYYSPLTLLWLLWFFVPVLLLAAIQSYRLFRIQPQDSVLWMIRCLLPLVLAAFLCGFSVSAGWVARWQPFSETQEAIEKLRAGGATAQLTLEDLAKVSALSPSTRRWLRDSSISVAPDQAHSGYVATIHLASGLDCKLAVGHYAGRSFNPEKPSCAQKGP